MADASTDHLRALLRDALPAWVLVPDSARVEWLNAVTQQLWPHIERGATKFLMEGKRLEGLLNSTTFWRPRVLADAQLQVAAVSLGQEPPRITGVKTFPQQGGQDKEVGVSNLVARGTLRVALKPLLDEIPIAGGIKVSFMGAPDFSYSTRVLGGNPYLVPGISQFVDSFVRDRLLTPLNFPDGFTYDLVTRSVALQEQPEGLLEVTVVEATGVPRMDTFGKCDPFCNLWVRESHKLRTTVKSRTLKPVWKESFTFMVHSTQHQELTMALYDSDFWSEDDLIGRVSLPLTVLDLTPGAVNDYWLPVPRAGTSRGEAEEGSMHRRKHTVRMMSNGPHGSSAANEQDLGSWPSTVSGRDDTAVFATGNLPRSTSSPFAAAAANAGVAAADGRRAAPFSRSSRSPGPPERQQSTASGSSMATVWSQQLRQLAANPLEMLRSKRCMLHITASYFPLTDQEIAAVAKEAGRQQRGEAEPATLSSSLGGASRLLRSGILYVWLDRATNLKAKTGFTKRMKVNVRVGSITKTTERGNVKLQHRANPVFEEMVELIVDGDTAQRSNTLIHIEIVTEHLVRHPSFQKGPRGPKPYMAARCPASRTLLAVVYATVLYATCTARLAAGKAGTSCPTAKKFLTCVTPQWTMPNMANVILNSNTPALTVLDFPGNVDLRAILPWNDGVTLTYRRTNHSIYQCQVPIFPGYQLMSYASKPASRYHSMFITCPRSPMWTGRQNYYVTGAFRNVSSLSKRAIKGLPQLQAWKTFYMPVARHLSMCLTINPCLMNVFLGISNLQKWVNGGGILWSSSRSPLAARM
ncbi:hypothetical protein CHLNCDRAFT_56823 [Chlorella variabilis]|uniref:C2 domain-containing protein n=1 Tax=Chlorella variabilis TaxID=554065 RepID=E1Z6P1_CHLVA|nr:hypothetical protein CHLNCDRAFT_56823 [Chlorella variabilis]EFN58384.1 hypothetical protein CHLNCDRAFT_56823 [Chlorella variabilis]|eukprot:XP_005850486.1 hypothetical protein CHLNCDRAFT_56823 [Chlorella variabilis]